MISASFKEAAVEVLDILAHTSKRDVEKIPESFITFLKENSSKTYVSKLDHSKAIKDMDLKPKTEAILALIYIKYWANEQEKQIFEKRIRESQARFTAEEQLGFATFDKERKHIKESNVEVKNELQTYKKQSWLSKLINKILKGRG